MTCVVSSRHEGAAGQVILLDGENGEKEYFLFFNLVRGEKKKWKKKKHT